MPQYNEKELFQSLLRTSQVFGTTGNMMLHRALDEETLPTADYEYLLKVMKMEQNLDAIIDARGEKMIDNLKQKYNMQDV